MIKLEKVCDVHTHLNPENLGAGRLRNIVGYHFLFSEMLTLGLAPGKFRTDIQDAEWFELILEYLPGIRNTSSYWMADKILKDIYGLSLDDLESGSIEKFEEKIRIKYKDPLWPWRILKEYCRTEKLFTSTEYSRDFQEPDSLVKFKRVCEKFNFGLGINKPVSGDLKNQIGKQAITPKDISQYVRKTIETSLNHGVVSFMCWLGRYPYRDVSEKEIERAIKDDRNPEMNSAIGCYQFKNILECLKEKNSNVVVQMIIGAHTASGINWPGRIFDMVNSDIIFSYHNLFMEFPGIKFNILVSSSCRSREIDNLARLLPNVSVSGTWLHTMFPNQIIKILSDRLEFLPAGKTTAFFSDAYNAEWVYGKLSLAKKCTEIVLDEKVKQGWLKDKQVPSLIEEIFWNAPERIFNGV
ncbi:MAG: hypothetical protein M1135_01300 [Candidatus Omnitrophica bacterium]|nr:hypothetical protein [Candidatus Omnitrophota bacterium]